MLTTEAITAALPFPVDAPTVIATGGTVVTLAYASAEVFARRVSDDVETLRELNGRALVESWTDAATPLAVCLRYAPAPRVEVPQPIAPVPAPSSRRR